LSSNVLLASRSSYAIFCAFSNSCLSFRNYALYELACSVSSCFNCLTCCLRSCCSSSVFDRLCLRKYSSSLTCTYFSFGIITLLLTYLIYSVWPSMLSILAFIILYFTSNFLDASFLTSCCANGDFSYYSWGAYFDLSN